MTRTNLGTTLLRLANINLLGPFMPPLSPSTPVAFFIEKGHAMEIIDLGGADRRLVALFWGPKEFAVKCHPMSELVSLDDMQGNTFTHGQVIQLLRKFPETHLHYRELRRKYQEKVSARQTNLHSMSDKARFADMVKTQPWILKLAEKKDIASYLHIPIERLRQFMK